MRITLTGQAGLYIETNRGSILCDPWFNPAYFGSWFPFPSNEDLDVGGIVQPDYLYISHLHHDHFDPQFLRDHVSKDVVVLLPDYPVPHLRSALANLGFSRFVQTRNREPLDLDGLRVMIVALVAPSDGAVGDSALAVDDGRTRIFNQNDAKPRDLDDLESIEAFGPYDGHFVQYSGASWFPMVYNFPIRMKQNLGRKKRQNEMARAKRYVEVVDASFVFPCAGPPCFLDEDLYHLNDFDRDPANIFLDQTVFLEYLQDQGMRNGRLLVPGSTATLGDRRCEVRHPVSDRAIEAIFTDKRAYLDAYRARQQPLIDRLKAEWPRGKVDIVPTLKAWWEPLLQQAEHISAGVNGRVLLEAGDEPITIDFLERRVDPWKGETCRYRFRVDRALVEHCILTNEEDWVNELFLSCRFEAEREGPYNEFVYDFFRCLSPERMQYAEGYYAEESDINELWRFDGYLVQRRCPHLKADLSRFGEVEDGILTCRMHGWQFELATGRCLTNEDRRLYAIPAESEAEATGSR